jgi:hypothetical protein
MKTAAIVLDDWKLPTFKRMLDAAGYEYKQFQGVTADTVTLKIKTHDLSKLAPLVREMENTVQRIKAN